METFQLSLTVISAWR